ncbi:NADH-quinone oxidoreductase subunit N [Streptomyces aidingensis]|uniref:NADH-quinone oxidoreductase subunit N n=1 Tax=Streptomyces aidingensis TaxID=910347 RepID=A0A1I1E3D0_9ACTN|nr:proton-conducting transporter membrane subunit [Streptomyces aidingensis]SFB81681.1 NADH-quinone oxidoreductase subunit N [Streptomyces aidingensis]
MNLIQTVDWAVIAPPAITAATALALLLADAALPKTWPGARRAGPLGALALLGIVLAGLSLYPLRSGDRATFCLTEGAGHCSYLADSFALIVQTLVLAGALLTVLISLPELGGRPGRPPLPPGEFWFLLLSSVTGAVLLPAARDLATLLLALEATTLPAYALVGLRRAGRAPEAALKFFLSSVTATAIGLLGISFVYAGAGSLFLAEIATALPEADPALATLAEAGVVLTLVAFAFKVSAVPFHFWVPETYLGAPLPVAGYLSVVSKTAGLAGLILVTAGAFPGFGDLWGPAVAVLAGLTMTAGNTAALRTRPDAPHSAVRLLAWSSIAQAGYLLVPLAAAAYAEDSAAALNAVGATVAYALMYAVVNLGAFAVVVRAAAGHRVADHRGLARRRPLTALAMGFFLLCLAGLPPGVVGLFAKVAVLRAAVDSGLGVLAVVAAVNVVIGLVYYLRWTAVLFREPAAPGPEPEPVSAEEGPLHTATATVTAAATAVRTRTGAPAALAVALAAVAALVLSGWPQIILHFASGGLF